MKIVRNNFGVSEKWTRAGKQVKFWYALDQYDEKHSGWILRKRTNRKAKASNKINAGQKGNTFYWMEKYEKEPYLTGRYAPGMVPLSIKYIQVTGKNQEE